MLQILQQYALNLNLAAKPLAGEVKFYLLEKASGAPKHPKGCSAEDLQTPASQKPLTVQVRATQWKKPNFED